MARRTNEIGEIALLPSSNRNQTSLLVNLITLTGIRQSRQSWVGFSTFKGSNRE